MTRMTAARLAEIESATRYESGKRNPVVQAVYKELLAELREVTRERDEALKANERLYKDCVDYAVNIWSLKEESDALRAENAKLKAVADAAKSIDWMDNAHDASIYVVTCKKADRLLAALASLDAKPGQEGA